MSLYDSININRSIAREHLPDTLLIHHTDISELQNSVASSLYYESFYLLFVVYLIFRRKTQTFTNYSQHVLLFRAMVVTKWSEIGEFDYPDSGVMKFKRLFISPRHFL